MLWPPKTEEYTKSGLKVYNAYKSKGYNNSHFAAEVGISPQYLCDILQGHRAQDTYLKAMLYWSEHSDEQIQKVLNKFHIVKKEVKKIGQAVNPL